MISYSVDDPDQWLCEVYGAQAALKSKLQSAAEANATLKEQVTGLRESEHARESAAERGVCLKGG